MPAELEPAVDGTGIIFTLNEQFSIDGRIVSQVRPCSVSMHPATEFDQLRGKRLHNRPMSGRHQADLSL